LNEKRTFHWLILEIKRKTVNQWKIIFQTHFTNLLLDHHAFTNFSMKTEDLELALVRYICLVKYVNEKDLDTSKIPYEDFSIKELIHYCSKAD
jgi:hypothetical protein